MPKARVTNRFIPIFIVVQGGGIITIIAIPGDMDGDLATTTATAITGVTIIATARAGTILV